jgi:hypothetical protein
MVNSSRSIAWQSTDFTVPRYFITLKFHSDTLRVPSSVTMAISIFLNCVRNCIKLAIDDKFSNTDVDGGVGYQAIVAFYGKKSGELSGLGKVVSFQTSLSKLEAAKPFDLAKPLSWETDLEQHFLLYAT